MILNEKYRCIWYILDNSHRLLLGICLYIFGLIGVLLNVWLASAFLQSPLLNSSRSYLLLLNLCISCLGRTILAGFPFAGTSALVGRWVFGDACCQLFGFLKQMLGVFQMIALSLVAFERYLVTQRKIKGNELSFTFYISGMIFCWIISVLAAVPPLFHYGNYRCDVTGIACDLDWRMKNLSQTIFNSLLLIFTGIIPILVIILSLWRANNRENRNIKSYSQRTLTKTVTTLTWGILLLWTPQGFEIFWIISGLGWAPRIFPLPLAVLSPLCTEAVSLIPVLTYLAYDERIRAALLNMLKSFKRSPPPRTLIR